MTTTRAHQLVHSCKKCFPCSTCGNLFQQHSHLFKQQHKHHPKRNFECCHDLTMSECEGTLLLKEAARTEHDDAWGSFGSVHPLFKVPANIDIKEEPSRPTTTLLPDGTCRDIEEEAVMQNSPPPLLSLVMESVDIKIEPSSPATTPPPHPLDVARTPQTSSTETSRDAPVADSETGIPNGTWRAPVEKCGSGAGSNSHVCDVCGRGLSTKGTLTRHRLSHSGERPYACSICDQRFAQKGNLARHYQSHKRGPNGRQCLQCNKLFMSSTALEEHQRRHNSKRRLYSCHVCPSSFMVKSRLDNHMLMHVQDDQRPRSCPVCKKCFSWWPSLITHMGQEHGGVENNVEGAGNSG